MAAGLSQNIEPENKVSVPAPAPKRRVLGWRVLNAFVYYLLSFLTSQVTTGLMT